jgi:hypothetical protein
MTGTVNTAVKLSVRISDSDWLEVRIETRADHKTQDRSDPHESALMGICRGNDQSSIRKLIKVLLKGGEEPDGVPGADQGATASGMIQQMIAILDGLEKSELDATGWVKNVDSYRAKVMDYLAQGLRDYLTTVHGEGDQKMGAGDPGPTALLGRVTRHRVCRYRGTPRF